jgi:hypothetical protein
MDWETLSLEAVAKKRSSFMAYLEIIGLKCAWIGVITNDWLKKYPCPNFCPSFDFKKIL